MDAIEMASIQFDYIHVFGYDRIIVWQQRIGLPQTGHNHPPGGGLDCGHAIRSDEAQTTTDLIALHLLILVVCHLVLK